MSMVDEQNAAEVWRYTISTGKVSYRMIMEVLEWLGENAKSGMEYSSSHGRISEKALQELVEKRLKGGEKTTLHLEDGLNENQLQSYETALKRAGVAFHHSYIPEKEQWELQFEVRAATAEVVEKRCRQAAERMADYRPSLEEQIRIAEKRMEADLARKRHQIREKIHERERA